MKLVILLFFCSSTIGYSQSIDPSSILDKLLLARGEKRNDYPEIKVLDRVKNIAAYSPKINTIILEKKAVEICLRMGKESESALAFIISHELTHFFQHKIWSSASENIAFFSSSKALENMKNLEMEADKYGAFLCYLAGYDYHKIGPKIIQALYEEYGLNPADLVQYPLPEERMALTLSVCSQVRNYANLFEAAQVLSHFGQYDWSNSINKYLLRFLDFKEIYNNAGVNALKLALSHRVDESVYPLIVKPKLSLRSGLDTSIDSVITFAINNLKTAIRKDPADHDLFINLASALLVKNDFDAFSSLIDQLSNVNLTKLNGERINVLNGIRFYKQGEQKTAIELISKVQSQTRDKKLRTVCKENLKIIKGKIVSGELEFNKNQYIPTHKILEEETQITIDTTDPLLPKKVQMFVTTKGFKMIFNNGMKSITLWMEKNEKFNSEYGNTYIIDQINDFHLWALVGA